MRHRRHRGAREGQPDARPTLRRPPSDASPPRRVIDLSSALDWLEGHINLEAKAGKVEGLSLDKMRQLAAVLGDPQDAAPVIHVTGTNGKGSSARMLTALLAELGLTVGTYTSPHLQRLNERLSRNGEPIADDELAEMLSAVAAAEEVVGFAPSYFEILTAAAFRWFADVAVDVAVVEVGLLGRFDATNVCTADIAVVTNVGHDHTDFEGDWRARIASEKAGIVKAGHTSTLVLGETDPDLLPIFLREGAGQVWLRGDEFDCVDNRVAVGGRLLDIRTPGAFVEELFLPVHGAHQGDNAAVALAAAEAFLGQPLADDVVTDAFAAVRTPGRFEVVQHQPLLVIDGAHNPDGAASAARTLVDDFTFEGRVILVVGMLRPRDVTHMLEALEADQARLVIACAPDWPRAIPPSEIVAAAHELDIEAIEVPDVGRAVDRARAEADEGDAILVTGSLYVVGSARSHLLGGSR